MQVKLAGCNSDFNSSQTLRTPESICAAYGRISRSIKSPDYLRLEAIGDVGAAKKTNTKIIFEYGHASIAEHAVLNFDIIGISRLAVEALESHRLVSFTEKSQRYVNCASIDTYALEEELESFVDAVGYRTYTEKCFKLYSDLMTAGIPGEDARYVLPLSTTTSLGMTINARNLELVIHSLMSNELLEVRTLGGYLYFEAMKIVPSLIKLRPDDIVLHNDQKIIAFMNKEYGKVVTIPQILSDMLVDGNFSKTNVSLTEYTKYADHLIADAHTMHIQGMPLFTGREEVLLEFYNILFEHMNEHSVVPRAFETANFYFILNLSASAFAQLKRHRMCTILPSPYWVRAADMGNFIIPDRIFIYSRSVVERVENLINESRTLYNRWLEKYPKFPNSCNYLLLNASTRFVQVSINMRSMYNFSRLRCDSHAQDEIRELANEMVKQIKQVAPLSGSMLGGKSEFNSIKELAMRTLKNGG